MFKILKNLFLAGSPVDDSLNLASPTTAIVSQQQLQCKNAFENACQWATTIKLALMPVTTSTTDLTTATTTNEQQIATNEAIIMSQLKVPIQGTILFFFKLNCKIFLGETGHLGIQLQSEADFSNIYQLFTQEVLGSGQFGTVLSGNFY